jgi:hypothetical protein
MTSLSTFPKHRTGSLQTLWCGYKLLVHNRCFLVPYLLSYVSNSVFAFRLHAFIDILIFHQFGRVSQILTHNLLTTDKVDGFTNLFVFYGPLFNWDMDIRLGFYNSKCFVPYFKIDSNYKILDLNVARFRLSRLCQPSRRSVCDWPRHN